jgi:hypothetical protein
MEGTGIIDPNVSEYDLNLGGVLPGQELIPPSAPTSEVAPIQDLVSAIAGPVVESLGQTFAQEPEQQQSRQTAMVAPQLSSAGAADPLSERQMVSSGFTPVNPALMSGIGGSSFETEEERKKRERMWMNNPILG